MLVNVEYSENHPIFGEEFGDFDVENIKPGCYVSHLNFNHQIEIPIKDEYPFSHLFASEPDKINDHRPSYGVCDYPDQLFEVYPTIVRSDRKFFVLFTEIRKDEQPEQGGWRWHKWGPYIGEKEPTTEYIYDEPEIERVSVFHVYEVPETYNSKRSIASVSRISEN